MFASRRAVSVASRQISCRAARALPQAQSARLYSTEAATSTAPQTEQTPAAEPKTSTVTRAKTFSTASKWPAKTATKVVTPAPAPAPAVESKSSTPSRSDVTYQPKSISYEVEAENRADSTSALPNIDWSNSFHGISSKPVTEKQFKILMQPVEEKDIEVKPDGVIYLPEIKYRRRLNEAFGPMGWGLIPKGEAVVGDAIVTREYALVVDGRFVSQAQGENSYFSPDQLPSAVEGCKSNALMRCCKDLGIASELWDPHFVRYFKKNFMEEVWVEHTTTKKKRTFWYKKGEVEVAYPYRLTK